MMEYQAVIKVGKGAIKVLFSDGSMSAMGVKPATYVTDSFMIQHAIENSMDFKRGKIIKVNTVELNEEVRIERNKPNALMTEQAADVPQASAEQADVEPNPVEKDSHGAEELPTESPNESENENLKQVVVACNDDAKDYLEDNFGVARSKFKNRSEIVSAGLTYGVNFVFN